MLWILVINILLRIFSSMVYEEYLSVAFYTCDIFLRLLYQNNTGFIECAGVTLSFISWMSLKGGYYFFFQYLMEITSEVIWIWACLWFNYVFNHFTCHRSILIYFFLGQFLVTELFKGPTFGFINFLSLSLFFLFVFYLFLL